MFAKALLIFAIAFFGNLSLVECLISFKARTFSATSLSMGSMKHELLNLQDNLYKRLDEKLALKEMGFSEQTKSWKVGEWEGTCLWFEEAKGSKLTGVSKHSHSSLSGISSVTLNVWGGPNQLVPNLLISLSSDDKAGVCIDCDFLQRGPTPLGSDFTYLETYYGKETIEWYDRSVSLPGAIVNAPPPSFHRRLIRSPVALSLKGLSMKDAEVVAESAVSMWLAWLASAQPVEARQKGAINGRDDKLRMFAYRAALFDAIKMVGNEFGPSLAAGQTGPVAEAYVGGGG